MLDKEDRENYLKKMKRPIQGLLRTNIFKKILAEAKKNKNCPWCDAYNPTVKKMPGHACKIIQVVDKKSLEERDEEMEATFENNPVRVLEEFA